MCETFTQSDEFCLPSTSICRKRSFFLQGKINAKEFGQGLSHMCISIVCFSSPLQSRSRRSEGMSPIGDRNSKPLYRLRFKVEVSIAKLQNIRYDLCEMHHVSLLMFCRNFFFSQAVWHSDRMYKCQAAISPLGISIPPSELIPLKKYKKLHCTLRTHPI